MSKLLMYRLLGVSVVSLTFLAACRGQRSESPPIHLNPNMDTQRRADPNESSSFLPGGIVNQSLEEGVVPTNADSGVAVSLEENSFPMKLDEVFLRRGQRKYETYCTPCHGSIGDGKGMVVRRGYPLATNLHDQRVRDFSLGQIYQTISQGIRNMPAYSTQIDSNDRWAIVAYVKALHKSQSIQADPH